MRNLLGDRICIIHCELYDTGDNLKGNNLLSIFHAKKLRSEVIVKCFVFFLFFFFLKKFLISISSAV